MSHYITEPDFDPHAHIDATGPDAWGYMPEPLPAKVVVFPVPRPRRRSRVVAFLLTPQVTVPIIFICLLVGGIVVARLIVEAGWAL